jgi:hypothetical protein
MEKVRPNYLGEVLITDLSQTEFKDFKPADWAMYFIERYGQYDGDWHKQWTMDQIARILKGTPVIVKQASWDSGQKEYRVSTSGETSPEYKAWAISMLGEPITNGSGDVEYEYTYETGIAP